MSERAGGVSRAPFASFNLGDAVGDDAAAVQENRRRLAERLGAHPVYLRQVHGTRVVNLDAHRDAPIILEADAALCTRPGMACTVLVADCLPVLFAAGNGQAVAAAHAGWRGLAGGVLEATVAALADAAHCAPSDLHAWLGPCIGPQAFEVGADVVQALGGDEAGDADFIPAPRADGSPHWLANLPQLARARLCAAGVKAITGGTWCTVGEPEHFFSYRRDKTTGRLAAAVWLRE